MTVSAIHPHLSRKSAGVRAMDTTTASPLHEVYAELAGAVTLRYLNHGVDLDELRAAGRRGLVAAAADFDPDAGVDFVTHALPRVRAAVKETFRNAGGRIGRPSHRTPAPVVHHPGPCDDLGWDGVRR